MVGEPACGLIPANRAHGGRVGGGLGFCGKDSDWTRLLEGIFGFYVPLENLLPN